MNEPRQTAWIDPVTLAVLLIFFVHLHVIMGDPTRLLSPQFGMAPLPAENQIMVQDFTNLYHYVRGTFLQITEHPYRVSEMNRMLVEWTGGASGFMPYLSPPTILLTFGTLTLFPSGIAYTLWMGCSFVGAAWTVSACRKLALYEKWWPLIVGWLAYFNLNSLMAINLGQTAFLTNTALLAIFLLSQRQKSRATTWAIGILLLLLTGKPQVSLVAVFYLLAENRWKEFWIASGCCAAFCALVTPLYGWTWPLDYLQSMTSYGSDSSPTEISETIGTTIMTNFRALVVETGLLLDTTAVRLSWVILLLKGAGLYLLKRWLPQLPAAYTFALACLIYLLWSPHLNPHEDFLLLPAVYAVLSVLPERKVRHWIGASMIMIGGLMLNMDMGLGFTTVLRPYHTVFWTKFLLLAYVIWLILKNYSDAGFFRQRQTTEQENNRP